LLGRAGEDDRRALLQVGEGDSHGVHHATEVHVHRVDECLRRLVLQRQDAGVGAHDVEPAERADPFLHCGAELIALAHIGLLGEDLLTRRLHLGHRVGHVLVRSQRIANGVDLLEQVDGDDAGPFFGETDAVGLALAACCAGDQSDLALESTSHGRTSTSPVRHRADERVGS
jgi:hypothetical protein